MSEAAVFSRLRVGGIELSNRIAVAPMSQYSAVDGMPGHWHLQHLGCLSLGGAGLLMIEFCAVAMEGRLTHGCVALTSDDQERVLAKMIGDIKAISPGVCVGLQIGHSGRKGSTRPPWQGGASLSPNEMPWITFAPSPIAFRADALVPIEMSDASIANVRSDFVAAARRALNCGVDVLEIHAAHGSLLHQFLSPLSNKRTDGYGGAGRSRALLEVIQDVRAIWPRERAMGVRLNVYDGIAGGIEVDEGLALAKDTADQGIDYLCVTSGGLVFPAAAPHQPGYQVGLARMVRNAVCIPVRTSGLITDGRQADHIIRNGDADFVAVGRAFIDDPRWAWHASRQVGGTPVLPPPYRAAGDDRWPALKWLT